MREREAVERKKKKKKVHPHAHTNKKKKVDFLSCSSHSLIIVIFPITPETNTSKTMNNLPQVGLEM